MRTPPHVPSLCLDRGLWVFFSSHSTACAPGPSPGLHAHSLVCFLALSRLSHRSTGLPNIGASILVPSRGACAALEEKEEEGVGRRTENSSQALATAGRDTWKPL